MLLQEEDKKARKAFEEELELDDEGVTCQILIHHIFLFGMIRWYQINDWET